MIVESFICRFDIAVVQYYYPTQDKVSFIGFLSIENSRRAKTSKAVGRWLIKKLK